MIHEQQLTGEGKTDTVSVLEDVPTAFFGGTIKDNELQKSPS